MRISDWSSDVCSSDLRAGKARIPGDRRCRRTGNRRTTRHRGGTSVTRIATLEQASIQQCFLGGGRVDRKALGGQRQRLVADLGIGPGTQRIDPAVAHTITELLLLAQSDRIGRSEEHTSELQSLMRISYAVFCLKKKI